MEVSNGPFVIDSYEDYFQIWKHSKGKHCEIVSHDENQINLQKKIICKRSISKQHFHFFNF